MNWTKIGPNTWINDAGDTAHDISDTIDEARRNLKFASWEAQDSPKDLKPVGVKAPLHLLPARPLRAISAAIEHGALKYAPWNYQDTSQPQARIDELISALLRHTTAFADPSESDDDPESGLHHLAHAGACVMLALYKLGIDYERTTLLDDPDA